MIVERLAKGGDVDRSGDVAELARAIFGAHGVDPIEELERPWARLWLAREGAKLLGFLVVWHVADELHVLSVATAPEARRRGVGRALLDELLRYGAANDVRVLVLEVRRSNDAAIGLYRSLGFTVLGVRARYYADNDEDAIEMMLALDPATGAKVPGRDEALI